MTTITTELAQRMRTAAVKATGGEWHFDDNFALSVTSDNPYEMDIQHVRGRNGENDMRFIALCSPKNIGALLDALAESQAKNALVAGGIDAALKLQERAQAAEKRAEEMEKYAKHRDEENQDLILTVGRLRVELEARTDQQPVLYGLRFKNSKGIVDREVNPSCIFTAAEKASQYRPGGNYKNIDGLIKWVPNPDLDPVVVPLYELAPASQPVTVTLPERHELQETSRNPYQSYIQMMPEPEGDWVRFSDAVEVLTAAGIKIAEGE